MVRFLLVTLVVTSCYAPSFRECMIECGRGDACPDGTRCNADGFCHASDGVLCGSRGEGGDGGDGDVVESECSSPSDCQDAPPPVCADSSTLRTFSDQGRCEGDVCSYDVSETQCADACIDGECVCATECSDLGANCGVTEAACGALECGSCSVPQVCGGEGVANACGSCETAVASLLCPSARAYLCSALGACFAQPVNCASDTMCPGEPARFFCGCGFVVDCDTKTCVPGDGSTGALSHARSK